jgi:hypothetical protein
MPMNRFVRQFGLKSLLILLSCLATGSGFLRSQEAPNEEVRLVLLIAIDQFRYDYLTRFRDEYTSGLDLLLRKGANYVNANLEHYPTNLRFGSLGPRL